MINRKGTFLIILSLLFQFSVTPGVGQEKKQCKTKTNLSIQDVAAISLEPDKSLWTIENLIYGIPKISPAPIKIKLATNYPTSALYLETASSSGNLGNSEHEIKTSYLLCKDKSKTPTSLDPRWKPGDQLRQFIQKNEHGGMYSWQLYVRLFADSSCNYGIYRDEVRICVIGGRGKRHVKTIGIQAELNEKSVSDRIRSEAYRPDIAGNVKSQNFVRFHFDSDELNRDFANHQENNAHVGFIPVSLFIPVDRVPCTFTIGSQNAKNYFADAKRHLKPTQYFLSPVDYEAGDIASSDWEDGNNLPGLTRRLTAAGEYQWKLWVKIQDVNTSGFSNSFQFLVRDSMGLRHSYQLLVNFK
ncbi:hypothetical protein JXJ21_25715 [candidate division KSB1 bacterium]|nr:hypothetical protein [candidate division KSB1 bacterium]